MSEPQTQRVYVRAPNRLGDVLMAIPALRRLGERYAASGVDVWCPHQWAPILDMAELPAAIIPFRRTWAIWRIAAWLRDQRYGTAYLFTPTLSSAVEAWLSGVPERRGTPGDGRRWLLSDRSVAAERPGEHRASFYLRLADPSWPGGEPPAPRLEIERPVRERFRQRMGKRWRRPAVGLLPGAQAPARRWPEGRFTALAGMLGDEAGTVAVFGGPEEEVLTARVAAGAGRRGVDLGGQTSLRALAAGLTACDLVIGNDTGPMHLAAAVGTPLIAIFGSSDPERTRPLGSRVQLLRPSALPCSPCRKNSCPRFGAGTFLPDAHEECMQLLSVEAVLRAAREQVEILRT